jgi:hypothetical protein
MAGIHATRATVPSLSHGGREELNNPGAAIRCYGAEPLCDLIESSRAVYRAFALKPRSPLIKLSRNSFNLRMERDVHAVVMCRHRGAEFGKDAEMAKPQMAQPGERFLIAIETLGIERKEGRRSRIVVVPSGAVVEVVNRYCPHDGRLTDVLWEEQSLALFAKDLFQLAERLDPAFAVAIPAAPEFPASSFQLSARA